MRRDLAGSGNSTVIFAQRGEENLRLSISGIEGRFLGFKSRATIELEAFTFHPEIFKTKPKASTQSNGLVC